MLLSPIKTKHFQEGFVHLTEHLSALVLIAFILGILLYFWGVPAVLIYTLSGIALVGILWARKKPLILWGLVLILTIGIGFIRIDVRTDNLDHPVLDKTLYHTVIKANVIQNIALPEKQILTLRPTHWPLGDFQHPELIRLNFYGKDPVLQAGDHIRMRAHIMSPKKINAYHKDFYHQIGGIGKAEEILSVQKTNLQPDFFENLRHKITTHLFDILPANQARIATPLITGEQRFVSATQYQNYRRSGIAHVLSVSGFHMALLAAFLFFLVRGFCVFTKLTLYINAKKVAAVIAFFGTLFYLALSGFQIPALRSFGMIALVFLGILTDRKAFSVHSLVLVGCAMLLYRPEMVLSISFQLSFLSVLILICVHERFKKVLPEMNKNTHRFLEFLLLNIALSVGLIPIVAYHFHQITPYGFVGNMMFSFTFSLAVMPLLFAGCLLMPLGLDTYFFKGAGFLLETIEQLTGWLSQWPFAEIATPSFSPIALGLMISGIVLICLMGFQSKWFGGLFLTIGIVWAYLTPQPVMMIFNQSIAYIQKGIFYQNKNGQDWIQNLWRQKSGFAKVESVDLPDSVSLKGQKIAFSTAGCLKADYAVLPHKDSRCRVPTLIPKKDTLYLIYIEGNKIDIRTFRE